MLIYVFSDAFLYPQHKWFSQCETFVNEMEKIDIVKKECVSRTISTARLERLAWNL